MTEAHDPDALDSQEQAELDRMRGIFGPRPQTSTVETPVVSSQQEGDAYKGKELEPEDLDALSRIKIDPENDPAEIDKQRVMDQIKFDVDGANTGDTQPLTPEMADKK